MKTDSLQKFVSLRHMAELIECSPSSLRLLIERGTIAPDAVLKTQKREVLMFLLSRRKEVEVFERYYFPKTNLRKEPQTDL